MRTVIEISQRQGTWIADIVIGAHRIGLQDDPRIAVIINDGDGRFDFAEQRYEARTSNMKDGAWWLWSKHEEWRMLVGNRRPFVIRESVGAPDARPVRAGKKKGLWRMDEVAMNDEVFSFTISERIGEVK